MLWAGPPDFSATSATLLRDPATDVFCPPNGHSFRELDWMGKGFRLNASPECRLGKRNESENLRLAQEAGFRQAKGGLWRGFRCRGRLLGGCKGAGVGHDRASSRQLPAKDMTCSFAVALGQGRAQADRERGTRHNAAGVPAMRQRGRNERILPGVGRKTCGRCRSIRLDWQV